jgi:CHAT domain-containing protein
MARFLVEALVGKARREHGGGCALRWLWHDVLGWARVCGSGLLLVAACLPAISAGLDAQEQARLDTALRRAEGDIGAGDREACRSTLAEVRELAWRAHSTNSFRWPNLMANCMFFHDWRPTSEATPAAVLALLEPWRLRFHGNPDNVPEEEITFLHQCWLLLITFEMKEYADNVFLPEVRSRIARLAARPGDAASHADLMYLARATYGNYRLHDDTRRFYDWFRQSLGPAHPVTLVTMRSLAYGEAFLGRARASLEYAERSVELAMQDRDANQNLLVGLTAQRAQSRAAVGRFAEALADMLQVRDALLQRQPPPMEGLVRTHYNLAGIALEMGDFNATIQYANRSIAYAHESGVPVMLVEARVPAAMREVARLMLGEPGAAQDLKAALEPTNADEMHIGSEAFALVRHAAQVGDAALLAWATEFMNTYIDRYRTPFHSDKATVPLMRAWQRGGIALRAADVRGDLDLALAGSITGRSLSTESLTQFSLARHLANPQPDEAVWLYKRGANALQKLRQGLPSGQAELHRAWLASHETDLRDFIGLLIDRGRLVEAEQAVLFLRDEEMVEYTRRSRANRSTAVQALAYTVAEAGRNVAFDALAQRVQQAAAAADKRADAWRTLAYKSLYRDDEADQALAGFQREVHELLAPAASPAGEAPRMRGASATLLPPGTARLTYFVREDTVDLVMQRGRERRSLSVPIARDELNRRVQALRVAVGSPQRDALAPARALHDVLIAPAAAWLAQARSTRVQIAPDAALRYVPFAALYDGRRFLAQRFAVTTDLNGSSGRGTAQAAARGIVAFGRSSGDGEHSALPGVERELASVRRQHGTVAMNGAFTAATLKRGLARGPALVHIASHFVLSPAGEDQSYLLLGDGQRLSLTELRQLPWQGVQLALLSACDSAVTVEAGSGRELVGFATALQGAGVRNVLASLWRVSDGATAQWMEMFYGQRARRADLLINPDTLAMTQRQWLRKHTGSSLAHPHYWAAFGWIGVP